jgi:Phosphomannomutase
MSIRFGTDGWRAVIGEQFTFENVRKVAYAHGLVLQEEGKKRVVVGYDRRFLSKEFAQEVCRVFLTLGLEAYLSEENARRPWYPLE